MKHWWGYLVAAIFAAFSWMLGQLGEKYSQLIDMVYPYVTRTLQSMLASWTGTVDVLVWQVAVAFISYIGVWIVMMFLFDSRGCRRGRR